MSDTLWWQRSLRMIQYNLQQKDTPLMDADKIAQETEDMHANAVVINLSDSVVWYRTAVHFQKVNPHLPEDRDLLQELIDAFHRRNIKVFARGALMCFEEETYYAKPQWAARQADGSPTMMDNDRPGQWYRLYFPCPSGGFANESGLGVAMEAFEKYDLDGAFWLGGVGGGSNCWCDRCKSIYFDSFGEEMPSDPQKIRPNWYMERARQAAIQFKDGVLKVKPDIPYLRYYWPFDLDIGIGFTLPADNIAERAMEGTVLCTEAQDTLSSGKLKLPYWNTPALRMKMGRTIENYPPPVGIIHICPGMDWRHTCIPEAEFMYWAAQIPANGGSIWETFTGFSDTVADKRMLKTVGRINGFAAKIEEAMYNASSDCQVLLLNDGGIFTQGWAEALMCQHIDFDMLAQYQLTSERIAPYPVVIIPKNFKFPSGAQEIFAAYVGQGGKLIVEGTEELALRPVKKLLGVTDAIVSSEDVTATYLRLEPNAGLLRERIGECDLIPVRGRIGFCDAPADATVLATWVPSFATPAIAGIPPERASLPQPHTNVPLCLVRSHGQGKVMFLPYEPSRLIIEYGLQDMFTMVGSYVDYMLADDKKIHIRAPQRVLTSVFQKDNLQLVHLINGIGQRPLQEVIPCHNIEVALRLDGKRATSVTSAIAGEAVECSQAGDTLEIRLPRLTEWDMLQIEFGR